ncbi:hypothetical protein AN958_00790 [Leucoagaricus sp. SymC.cos]|nr:hypothetical protein AN958_00790 [Leucoagaricus sp. SymC.cos]
MYGFVCELFVVFRLVLEHNKSELFHFSCFNNDNNPSIDLGYASYTGDSSLHPNTYWRYLGFYFDHQLNFCKHVWYYSTKAISTVHTIGILGNSLWGLSSK